MELNMKSVSEEEMRYQQIKKKVRHIRDFYINLGFFCFFIPVIIFCNLYFVPEFHWFWFSISGWGIGMIFHGLAAFEYNPFMMKGWEERKLRQFMEEELKREQFQNNLKNQ